MFQVFQKEEQKKIKEGRKRFKQNKISIMKEKKGKIKIKIKGKQKIYKSDKKTSVKEKKFYK